MLRNLFKRGSGGSDTAGATTLTGPRVPRHSSGWSALLKFMQEETNLRVLDIGPTSSQSINLLTGFGHSVYMADIVHESLTGAWTLPPKEDGEEAGFDSERFLDQNLNFSGREFDVVMLWSTLDYIPQGLVQPLTEHLRQSVRRGGMILATFHAKATGPNTQFCRYHLTSGSDVEMQQAEPHPILRVFTNRNIEKLFANYRNYRFFLAKDNLYEVLLTR